MLVPHAAIASLLLALPLSVSPFASASSLPQKGADEATDVKEADVQFDLETIFDEKGLFGPSARSVAFSSDGRYAAYLWRPYAERRHGNDLYLVDVQSGEVRRMTSVSVLAPFQEDTAKVGRDRIKKAGPDKAQESDEGEDDSKGEDAGAKDAGEASTGDKPPKKAGSWSELKDKADSGADSDEGENVRDERMDIVSDDDADDKEGPRYRGISSFVWAPDSAEMLVSTGGDVYRLDVDGDGDLIRLTRTRDSERRVQYLPDGSGYTTLVGDALVRVRFGEHFVEQLDPELPSGMEMRDYRLSPDGESLVFIASEGRSSGGARTVNIATYNDRFMEVRKVPRTVSDDPIRRTKSAVFLYRLPDATAERGRLVKVYTREASGPRDVMRLPDWAPDSSKVAFAVFDQESAQVHVLESESPKGEAEPSDESFETIDARIVHRFLHNGGPTTPRMIAPMYLADSRRIVLLTEQTGFRHPHVLDPTYETLSPLTSGRYEVYPIGMPEDRSRLFVAATKEDSACQDVYSINLDDGAMTRLTKERGQYTGAAVSQDGGHVMATFTAFGAPRELVHVRTKSGDQTALTESHPKKALTLTADAPTFFSYDNRHGQTIQGHLFLPDGDRAEDDKRPLLIYVYGGPLGTRKQVTEGNFGSDGYFFANYLAKTHGWITCTIDPRGMSGYGALFEKANFERVGLPQVEDLVDGVKFLVENHGVDPERVGIHGWSFGGFQTQMCLYTEPEVFKCGIAGAGPTEWENYNSWYSTGTIGDSREGKTDLDKYSLLPLAKNLEGKLLLVHGMEDANVLYQDTVRVYAELLDAGKETLVELFVDPSGGHGLGGHVKRLARFRKYEEFLLRTLP